MKEKIASHLVAFLVAFTGLSWPESARPQGIPEPSLILYGTIRNTAQNNRRVTSGALAWRFRDAGGQTITFTTTATNLLEQFSYVLKVRCEQYVSGLSTNALNLSGMASLFDRSQVLCDGIPASFALPAQTNVSLSARDRGRIERVDLLIALSCDDNPPPGNGLCDWWENLYFGYVGVIPDADEDGDGMSNWAEFKAGTNPTNSASVFQFLTVKRVGGSGVQVEWESADGRYYSLLRYPSLLSTNYAVVQNRILATTPQTAWLDTNAPPTGTYFYRLQLEP